MKIQLLNLDGVILGETQVIALPILNFTDNPNPTSANYEYFIMKLKDQVVLTEYEVYELKAFSYENGDESMIRAKSQDDIYVPCVPAVTSTVSTTTLPPVTGPESVCVSADVLNNAGATASTRTKGRCSLDLAYLLRTSTARAFEEFLKISELQNSGSSAVQYCYSYDSATDVYMCRSLKACLDINFKNTTGLYGTEPALFC